MTLDLGALSPNLSFLPASAAEAFGQAAILLVVGLAFAVPARRNFYAAWFGLALATLILYELLLTRFFGLIPSWPPGADWNWLGKVLSFSGMLMVAAAPIYGWARCGVTLDHRKGAWIGYAFLAVLCAWLFYAAWSGGGDAGGGRADWETFAFQWTMPGLDEELFYRGVLLLALNEAFRARWTLLGARIGYGGLLTVIAFGLAHALDYDKGYTVDLVAFLETGPPSLILLWLREKTGNLIAPVIAHNAANGAFTLF